MATRVRSFSKVNLGLRIGPVRADGFHGLVTLYQTLALHDVVTVSARRAGVTRILLTTDHLRVPVDGRNTAWQMVERALEAMGVAAEVSVHIEKRLPVQGGMGAGSANAAAALLGLEQEMAGWGNGGGYEANTGVSPLRPSASGRDDGGLGLSGFGLSEAERLGSGARFGRDDGGFGLSGCGLSEAERLRVAAEVGSDVPLFLVGGAVLGEGRGEWVTAMPDVTMGHTEQGDGRGVPCVVALPRVGVSTPMAFREWDRLVSEGGVDGLTPRTEATRLEELSLAYSSAYALSVGRGAKSDTSGIVGGHSFLEPLACEREGTRDDLAENTLLALVRTGIENDFEEVVFPHHPSLREIKRLLMGEDSGQPAVYAALSGSGSALFGLYGSEGDARAAQRRVQSSGTEAILTETLTRAEYWKRTFADVG